MMDTIFLKLLNMSICAGWLILAVIVLRAVLKKTPKWVRCVLWAFVAVRLVCPFSLESAFSLVPSAATLDAGNMQFSKSPEIHSGLTAIDNAVNPAILASLTPETGADINPLHAWIWAAAAVWLIGLCILAGCALSGYIRLRHEVREAAPLRDHLYLCDAVRSPFILGILRPAVYLPTGLDEETTRYILAHEHAHLKRRDHWWKALGYALLCLYWFHPLVWIAYTLFCRDIELACDERVVRHFDLEKKKAYSHALVSCSVGRKAVLVCPLAFGEVGVKNRVKAVLHYKKPAFRLVGLSVVVCALVAVCFLTDPVGEAKEPSDEALSGAGTAPADGTDPQAPQPDDAQTPHTADGSDPRTPRTRDTQTPHTADGSDPQTPQTRDTQTPHTADGSDPQTPQPDDAQTPHTVDGTGKPADTGTTDRHADVQTGSTGYPLYDSLIAAAANVLAHPQEADYDYERTLFTSAYFYSGMTWQTPGYLLMDLDGNGVDELLFGENHDDSWNGIIFNIYTISDGALVHVADGWERSRYYLCENGCIANEGSGGASESTRQYFTYEENALKMVESVVYDAASNPENPWFYTTDDPYSETAELSPVSEDEARAVMDRYVYVLPQFTPFITAP